MINKKKVAILTFHRAVNYGAVLQCFAFYHSLSKQFEVDVLDYRCHKIEEAYFGKGNGFIGKIKHLLFSILHLPTTIARRKKNRRFFLFLKQNISLSNPCDINNVSEIANIYNAIVVGSDQVWNLNITGNDKTYFLPFVPNEKRFSYAVSFNSISAEHFAKEPIINFINAFKYLSLRESHNIALLPDSLKSKAVIDCDPVFLVSSKEWINKFHLIKSKRKKYILIYLIAPSISCLQKAYEFASNNNLEVVFLSSFENNKSRFKKTTCIKSASPEQFLQLIYGSEAVFTTSFHATAFSLIFNVKVFYELNKNTSNSNARFFELEETFGLKNCRIEDKKPLKDISIDWIKINNKINAVSSESLNRLNSKLAGETDE